jgi:HNH endonuclease
MDAATRRLVWRRARNRCEYCRLHQDDDDFASFHVEHIVAKQHSGSDRPDNLCLSCAACNLAKGPNLAGHLAGRIVPLFNPRDQRWDRHFRWDGGRLVGRTRCGVVTIYVLNINDPGRVRLREGLIEEGRFPPSGQRSA